MNKEHKVSPKFLKELDRSNNIHPRLRVYEENIRAIEYDLKNVKTSAARMILEIELKKLNDKYKREKENIGLMESVNTLLIKEGLITR